MAQEVDEQHLNQWSYGKTIKIPVLDFYINYVEVKWKDKVITVEHDLFMGMIKQWVADGMTKEEALDLAFLLDIS